MCVKMSIGYSWPDNLVMISKLRIKIKLGCLFCFLASIILLAFLSLLLFWPLIRRVTYTFNVSICWGELQPLRQSSQSLFGLASS